MTIQYVREEKINIFEVESKLIELKQELGLKDKDMNNDLVIKKLLKLIHQGEIG